MVDSTPDPIRDALAAVLKDMGVVVGDDFSDDEITDMAANLLARLVEHRDEVLALLGLDPATNAWVASIVAEVMALRSQLDEAVRLLAEVADWCGTSDWSGPQLPSDVARRMSAALNKEGK